MKISKEIQFNVINDYKNSKLKIKEIAKKYSLCRQSIRNIIIENNEKLRVKLSEKIKKQIIKEYSTGSTNKYLSTKYNVHRCTVQSVIKNSQIQLRDLTTTSRKHILINFNNGIITNNDAYLLGLIYADGNLSKNAIEISLHEKDKELLLNISNYVYGKDVLKYRKSQIRMFNNKQYKCGAQYRFLISSKNVVSILKEIGLTENKSLTVRFPTLENKLISHFIRGVFDGDGCIFVSKKYKGTNRVTIVSNYMFCEDLKIQIEKYLDINICIQIKTKNVGTMSIAGNNQIKKFMDWIYNNAELKMERKFVKFNQEYNN